MREILGADSHQVRVATATAQVPLLEPRIPHLFFDLTFASATLRDYPSILEVSHDVVGKDRPGPHPHTGHLRALARRHSAV